MKRLRTKVANEFAAADLRRIKKHKLKYITVLPSLITILNGVCGFAAIVLASKGAVNDGGFSYHRLQLPYFAMAGYMVLIAMIADMLDGRLARMSKSTSSFGGQLDSLCDVISFGVAPAFLMLQIFDRTIATSAELNSILADFLHRFVWLTAAAYISCTVIRLARFNVENEEDETAHMVFTGLPSPAAAGVIVSIVIFQQEELPDFKIITYVLPFLALAVAVLMVSRIRYPHVLNQYLKGKKPFAHLIRLILLMSLITWRPQAALALIFCSFAAGSFLKWLYYKIIRKKDYPALSAESPASKDMASSEDFEIPRSGDAI
jgi:CDP-diacylglycerol--serine O-phosphatidyltransferase